MAFFLLNVEWMAYVGPSLCFFRCGFGVIDGAML